MTGKTRKDYLYEKGDSALRAAVDGWVEGKYSWEDVKQAALDFGCLVTRKEDSRTLTIRLHGKEAVQKWIDEYWELVRSKQKKETP